MGLTASGVSLRSSSGSSAQGEARPQEMCSPNCSQNLHQGSTMTFSCQGFLILFCLPPSAVLLCNDAPTPWVPGCTPQTQLTAAMGEPQPLQLLGPTFMSCPGINLLMGRRGMCGWEWILFCLSSLKPGPRAPERAAAARAARGKRTDQVGWQVQIQGGQPGTRAMVDRPEREGKKGMHSLRFPQRIGT